MLPPKSVPLSFHIGNTLLSVPTLAISRYAVCAVVKGYIIFLLFLRQCIEYIETVEYRVVGMAIALMHVFCLLKAIAPMKKRGDRPVLFFVF